MIISEPFTTKRLENIIIDRTVILVLTKFAMKQEKLTCGIITCGMQKDVADNIISEKYAKMFSTAFWFDHVHC